MSIKVVFESKRATALPFFKDLAIGEAFIFARDFDDDLLHCVMLKVSKTLLFDLSENELFDVEEDKGLKKAEVIRLKGTFGVRPALSR